VDELVFVQSFDQNTAGQKVHLREGETPTAEFKSKIEVGLDKQWVWGGSRGIGMNKGEQYRCRKKIKGGNTGNLEGRVIG